MLQYPWDLMSKFFLYHWLDSITIEGITEPWEPRRLSLSLDLETNVQEGEGLSVYENYLSEVSEARREYAIIALRPAFQNVARKNTTHRRHSCWECGWAGMVGEALIHFFLLPLLFHSVLPHSIWMIFFPCAMSPSDYFIICLSPFRYPFPSVFNSPGTRRK